MINDLHIIVINRSSATKAQYYIFFGSKYFFQSLSFQFSKVNFPLFSKKFQEWLIYFFWKSLYRGQ